MARTYAHDELSSGERGGVYWEVLAAVCPDRRETLTAPIDFEVDRERRVGSLRVGDLLEARAEPITSPVTGEEHRAQIVLPEGFEYRLLRRCAAIRETRAPLPASPAGAAVVAALVAATDDHSEPQPAQSAAEIIPTHHTWRRMSAADHARWPIIK